MQVLHNFMPDSAVFDDDNLDLLPSSRCVAAAALAQGA